MAAVTLGLTLAATPAFAQRAAWTDRGFFNVSFGGQSKERSETSSFAFPLYEEDARVNLSRVVASGTFPDIMAGARLWQGFGLAGQFSQRKVTSDAALAGSLPDPYAFNSPRTVTATVTGMEHREQWASIMGVYLIPITRRIHVMGFGGPSVVSLHHDVVDGVSVSETAADPTIAVQRKSLSRSVWGVVAGVDVRYMLTARLGVGAFGRVQSAKVNLPEGGFSVETGGAQGGVGVRIAF